MAVRSHLNIENHESVIVSYCIVLHFIVLYCIILVCIALHCSVLYCIVLYCRPYNSDDFVLHCVSNDPIRMKLRRQCIF